MSWKKKEKRKKKRKEKKRKTWTKHDEKKEKRWKDERMESVAICRGGEWNDVIRWELPQSWSSLSDLKLGSEHRPRHNSRGALNELWQPPSKLRLTYCTSEEKYEMEKLKKKEENEDILSNKIEAMQTKQIEDEANLEILQKNKKKKKKKSEKIFGTWTMEQSLVGFFEQEQTLNQIKKKAFCFVPILNIYIYIYRGGRWNEKGVENVRQEEKEEEKKKNVEAITEQGKSRR